MVLSSVLKGSFAQHIAEQIISLREALETEDYLRIANVEFLKGESRTSGFRITLTMGEQNE